MLTIAAILLASQAVTPVVTWTGPDSKITEARKRLVRNDVDWLALWAEHRGQRWSLHDGRSGDSAHVALAAPRIDFERYMVVAVFGGTKTGIEGMVVEKIEDEEKRQVLVLADLTHRSTTFVAHPYAFFLIPKTDKAVIIREVLPDSEAPMARR